MASRIPFDPRTTVAPDSPAPVFQRINADPAAFGADVAQAGAGMGRALGQAADTAFDYQMQRQLEANKAEANDVEIGFTKSVDEALFNPKGGYFTKKGKDAVDALPEAIKVAERARVEALAAATSPNAKRMVDPVVSRALQANIRSMYAHASQQEQVWKLSSAESLTETMIDSAALNYRDDYRWGETVGGIKHQAAEIAKLKGMDDEGRKVVEQKYLDRAWKDRLEAWRLQDPQGAFAKWQQAGESMSPTLRVTLGHQLFQAAAPGAAARLNQMGGPAIPVAPSVPEPTKNEALPRGVRNNNPGNIVLSGVKWDGEIDGTDPRYAAFESPEAGIRAMSVNLKTYQEKYGLTTVEGIVGRWAPATENDTAAYVKAVAKDLGVKPGDPLNLADAKVLLGLTRAIIKQENGRVPYTDEQIAAGVAGKVPKAKGEMTPEQAATMLTGDPMVDAMPQDWKMHVVALARTQAAQDRSQERQGLDYRVRDAMAMYEAGKTPPNVPSGPDVMRVYGQEHGARVLQQISEAQQFGQDVQTVTTMSTVEQAELLARRAPVAGDGFEFAQKRHEQLARAIDNVQKARAQDPAAFAMTNTPTVLGAYRAMGAAQKPEERAAASQAYAGATLAEQVRLEIRDPQILAKNYVDEITRKFYQPGGKDGEQPVDVASVVRGIDQQWGRFAPAVWKQLSKSIPPGAVVMALGVKPEAEQLIGEALKMKPEAANQGLEEGVVKDVRDRVRNAFEPLRRSLAYVGGGQSTYDNYADTAEKLAVMLVQQGTKPADAATKAFESMAGFKYEFEDAWRVPKAALGGGASVSNIRAGATMARFDVGESAALAVPQTPGAVRGADAEKQWRQTVQDNGVWVTAPGDMGLALYVKSGLGAQPVLDAAGRPIIRTWDELNRAGSSVSAAFTLPDAAARMRGGKP